MKGLAHSPEGGLSIPSELVARLEVASEGCRELDALIWAAFRPEKLKVTGWNKPYHDSTGRTQVSFCLPPKRTRMVTQDRGPFLHADPVTTSIDAALALAERVLPGWGFFLRKDKDGCNCGLVYPEASFVTPGCGSSATPALALCLAILKATTAASQAPSGYEGEAVVNQNPSSPQEIV